MSGERVVEPCDRADTVRKNAVARAVKFATSKVQAGRQRRQFRTFGWFLAVALRAEPSFRLLTAVEACDRAESVFLLWSGQADSVRAWETYGGDEDSLGNPSNHDYAFLSAWDRVPERPSLDDAVAAAAAEPVGAPALPGGQRHSALRRFASTLAHLGARHGDGVPFPVPTRTFGELHEVSHRVVCDWLRFLSAVGLVKLAKPASPGMPRRAAEYLWLGPLPSSRAPGSSAGAEPAPFDVEPYLAAVVELYPRPSRSTERPVNRYQIRRSLTDAARDLPSLDQFRAALEAFAEQWRAEQWDGSGKRKQPGRNLETAASWIYFQRWNEMLVPSPPPLVDPPAARESEVGQPSNVLLTGRATKRIPHPLTAEALAERRRELQRQRAELEAKRTTGGDAA